MIYELLVCEDTRRVSQVYVVVPGQFVFGPLGEDITCNGISFIGDPGKVRELEIGLSKRHSEEVPERWLDQVKKVFERYGKERSAENLKDVKRALSGINYKF